MPVRFILVAISLGLLAVSCATRKTEAQAASKPGILRRITQGVLPKREKPAAPNAKRQTKGLVFAMEIAPEKPRLSDDRRLKATLSLANNSRKFVQLQFPTTQRIEVIVRDKAGGQIVQWSEDQSFLNEVGYLAINPGERVEYAVLIPTRDMNAGTEYVVEGLVPNYPEFRARRIIVPVP
jgi:hypothetical protein